MCKLTTSGLAKNTAKKLKKLFKNLLTSVLGCGIIVGLSKKGRFEDSGAKASRGSLTIEQQEIKVQAKACDENLEISLKKKS